MKICSIVAIIVVSTAVASAMRVNDEVVEERHIAADDNLLANLDATLHHINISTEPIGEKQLQEILTKVHEMFINEDLTRKFDAMHFYRIHLEKTEDLSLRSLIQEKAADDFSLFLTYASDAIIYNRQPCDLKDYLTIDTYLLPAIDAALNASKVKDQLGFFLNLMKVQNSDSRLHKHYNAIFRTRLENAGATVKNASLIIKLLKQYVIDQDYYELNTARVKQYQANKYEFEEYVNVLVEISKTARDPILLNCIYEIWSLWKRAIESLYSDYSKTDEREKVLKKQLIDIGVLKSVYHEYYSIASLKYTIKLVETGGSAQIIQDAVNTYIPECIEKLRFSMKSEHWIKDYIEFYRLRCYLGDTAKNMKLIETLYDQLPTMPLREIGQLISDMKFKLKNLNTEITAFNMTSKADFSRFVELKNLHTEIGNAIKGFDNEIKHHVKSFKNNMLKSDNITFPSTITLMEVVKNAAGANAKAMITKWSNWMNATMISPEFKNATIESQVATIEEANALLVIISQNDKSSDYGFETFGLTNNRNEHLWWHTGFRPYSSNNYMAAVQEHINTIISLIDKTNFAANYISDPENYNIALLYRFLKDN